MNRNGIIKHVELWKQKLGSYSAVARKCNINVGALSTIMAGKYGANEDKMLQRIAKALNYRESNWQLCRDIANYRLQEALFRDAKEDSLWFAISNNAGSGKSATLEDLYNRDMTGTVTFIQAEEWHARKFLVKLVEKTLGETALKGGYKTIADLLDMVVGYFNDMSLERPILIVDEADKLRPAALRTLIPLFNRTEDRLGVILSGTENFEKEVKAGVRHAKKGYDELESRFGRSYIHLPGVTEREVMMICEANGVTQDEAKAAVWGEIDKERKQATVRTATGSKDVMMDYVTDLRRLKRIIKRTRSLQRAA